MPKDYVANLPSDKINHRFTAVTADKENQDFYGLVNDTDADASGLRVIARNENRKGFRGFKGYRSYNMTDIRLIRGLQFWNLIIATPFGWHKSKMQYIQSGIKGISSPPSLTDSRLIPFISVEHTGKIMPELPCANATQDCPSRPVIITTSNTTTANITSPNVIASNTVESSPDSNLVGSLVKRVPNRGILTQQDTHITLVNATPYRWRRGYNHTHQVITWSRWPEYINPGESFQIRAAVGNVWIPANSAAEVAYHLEGTTKPMSFMVKYLSGVPHQTSIEYLEEFKTIADDKGSEHNLGWSKYPGGVGFVVSGVEDHFYAAEAPIPWMQTMIEMIGDLPLREISMVRSHNAGMYKSTGTVGFGNKFATQTQKKRVFDQLHLGGARVLDLRTAMSGSKFYTGHGAFVLGSWNGQLGASFDEIIDDVNRFNDMYPGELIIIDMHSFETWNAKKRFRALNVKEREAALNALKRLRHRAVVPDDEDLTTWKLNKFVGSGTSSVIVRINSSWLADGTRFPGGTEGFVTEVNFPANGHWSNTGDSHKLVADQLAILPMARPSRAAPVYNADWIITLQGAAAAIPIWSLPEIAGMAWRDVYHQFWDAMTDITYPNWITLDDVSHEGGKTLVMAINQCLAARKCGQLSGKVTMPLKPDASKTNKTSKVPAN